MATALDRQCFIIAMDSFAQCWSGRMCEFGILGLLEVLSQNREAERGPAPGPRFFVSCPLFFPLHRSPSQHNQANRQHWPPCGSEASTPVAQPAFRRERQAPEAVLGLLGQRIQGSQVAGSWLWQGRAPLWVGTALWPYELLTL